MHERFTLRHMSAVKLCLGVSCLLVSCILLALQGQESFLSQAVPSEGRRLRHIDDKGIPLTLASWGGGPRLLVDVQPQRRGGGWLPKQRLLLDTGSSTLAFCDRQMKVAAEYEASDWLSCNEYGTDPGFSAEYWGPFVSGDIQVGQQTWKNSSYSIMELETQMSCTNGIDGIFGIAFEQGNWAFPAESLSEIVTSEHNFSCPKNASYDLVPPLMQQLSTESSQKIGILWGVGLGNNTGGRLYLGQEAVENEHYREYQQYAMAAKLVEEGWYNIEVQNVSIGNETFARTCDPRTGSECVMDTGTPSIVLPPSMYEATIEQNGTMVIELAASNGSIEITLDTEVCHELGWIEEGSEDGPLILGLPLWFFYYTVFDIKAKEVVFLPKFPEEPQQSGNARRLLQLPALLV